jgi:signal transduction histidine kinase
MPLLEALALDLGVYAAAMAIFAAITCYRANPLRAVNRYFAAMLLSIALWQVVVALARTSHDALFWAAIAAPMGGIFALLLFILHDAIVDPHTPLGRRLARNRIAWLTALAFTVGAILANAGSRVPDLFPFSFRIVALLGICVGMYDLRKQRRSAKGANPYELLLFRILTVYLAIAVALFMSVRTPIGSRLITGITIIFLSTVIGLLLAERVFDAGGTARIAFGYVLRFSIYILLLVPVLEGYHTLVHREGEMQTWSMVFLVALSVYPISLAADWVLRRLLRPFASKAAAEVREAAIAMAASAESERQIIDHAQHLAKGYLGGLDVEVFAYAPAATSSATDDRRLFLVDHTRRDWLSPESAVRQVRGPELDPILDAFRQERLGAVVKYAGRKATIAFFVSERAGGSKSIKGEEMDFLHELASIVGTGIDRVRAVEESFRTRGLAMVGRFAADFSHSARNQIAAIQTLVEAVRDGEEGKLSPAYREAVYQETLALAANHAMALEITRLRADRVDIKAVAIGVTLESIASSYGRIARKANGRLDLNLADRSIHGMGDERLLRQVLLNLIRNGLQAAVTAGMAPEVTIRASVDREIVHIDVIDNGPGVRADVYDRLFTPWATTKADGTGLGLSFCLEAMRAMGGSISYLTPRGARHAWFQVGIPSAPPPAVTAPMQATAVGVPMQ